MTGSPAPTHAPTPPAVPRALLARVLGRDPDARAVQGDLWEDFVLHVRDRGLGSARRWYWREAIGLCLSTLVTRLIAALHRTPRSPCVSTFSTSPAFDRRGIARDVRHALRAVRHEPGFFGVAVVILGLGIGACTAMFSVMTPLLLRALPFAAPERLAWIAQRDDPDAGMSAVTSRSSNLRDFRALSETFVDMSGYNAFFGQGSYNLVGEGDPERLVGVDVTENFLDVLGVPVLIGRNFAAEEAVFGGPPAVILSHGFWQRRFAGDPAIVERAIDLNGAPTDVVGVLPPSFDFASIFSPGTRVDFLLPWPISDETDRQGNSLSMIGRLSPGVSLEQAQAELDQIVSGLEAADPNRWGLGASVSSLSDAIAGPYRAPMLLLMAAAATVMLIVCVNLSNLLMAKGAKRAKELAVRRALGATRGRLVRQLLIESMVLTFAGSVVGVGLAWSVTRTVAASTNLDIPLLRTASIDGTALWFTMGVAVAAGLLMGVLPALQSTGHTDAAAINDASRGSSAGHRSTALREALVVAEVSMACVLIVFGGLFLKSLRNVLDVDLGFQAEEAAGWTLSTNRQFDDIQEMNTYFTRVVAAVEAVPGVEAVGLVDALPLGRNRTWGTIRAPGIEYDEEDERPSAFPHIVDHRYLDAMRIPLVAGRNFTPDDTRDRPGVVILNESAARGVFRGADPIRRTVTMVGAEWEVVGVAADVHHRSPELGAGWQIYFPYTQMWSFQTLDMVVRSRLPMASLVPGVAGALRAADPTMPTDEYRSIAAIVDQAVSPRRFLLVLLGAFGGVGLLLAALGIYGVLSYSVAERTPEIGIRMALGESALRIQRRVVGRTVALAGIGIAIGALVSFVGTRWISSLLYGVAPTDLLTFSAMALILLTTALFAGYIPARRASRIDPTLAFRWR